MNISLSPDSDAIVEARVASGLYGSATEVVEEALRLIEERDEDWECRRARFEAELNRRLDSLDRGEGLTLEQVKEHFRQKAALARQQNG